MHFEVRSARSVGIPSCDIGIPYNLKRKCDDKSSWACGTRLFFLLGFGQLRPYRIALQVDQAAPFCFVSI